MSDLETNIYHIRRVFLRVAVLGNLLIFVLVPDNDMTHRLLKWYLTVLFLETELFFLAEHWHKMITYRRQRQELRQWATTTLVLRDYYHQLGYQVYYLNVLLVLVWFSSWTYITYFCGVAYSVLILRGI